MLKRTPLYEEHRALNGKMVDYAGYELPMQYEAGLIAEHRAVREAAGLFDVSHMGEFMVSGPDSLENLNRLMTNNFTSLKPGRMRYTLMLRQDGGTLDDLIIARISDDRYLLIVNAANREDDSLWIREQLQGAVHFSDMTDDKGLLALQGPKAEAILSTLTDKLPTRGYRFEEGVRLKPATGSRPPVDGCMVSRTGYTGEDGFEIMCDAGRTADVWRMILEAGASEGILPCGLGARDSLRLEAGMPLYDHELSTSITPYEADLGFAVKPDEEHPFIGQKAIEKKGTPRIRVGLVLTGRGIAREGAEVYNGDEPVGTVTSGTFAPFLEEAVAMAMVPPALSEVGTTLQVKVRKRLIDAKVVELPFYRREKG